VKANYALLDQGAVWGESLTYGFEEEVSFVKKVSTLTRLESNRE